MPRSGGAALRPLEWLVDMQVLARTVPLDERDPRKSRRVIYRVTDPYVAFWHRFVAPLAAVGSIGLVDPRHLWTNAIEPRLANYMGAVFEEACRLAVRQRRVRLPFVPVRVGEWWDASSTEQIDVVALGGEREMFVAECKWGAVTGADLHALERRAKVLAAALGGVRTTHLALFAGRGGFDASATAAVAAGRALGYTATDVA